MYSLFSAKVCQTDGQQQGAAEIHVLKASLKVGIASLEEAIVRRISPSQSTAGACKDLDGAHALAGSRQVWLTLPDVFFVTFSRDKVSTVFVHISYSLLFYTLRVCSDLPRQLSSTVLPLQR